MGRAVAYSALRTRSYLERFRRDQRGAVTLMLLPMFLLLVFATGLAIDLVRYEAQRADLQNALDRGVLAATSLTQTRDANEVVADYVSRRQFTFETPVVNVSAGGISTTRNVSADASYVFDTAFLNMVGLKELGVAVGAAAIEGTGNVEISLVLDISGSMAREATGGSGLTRLEVLQTAAGNFVDTLLSGDAAAVTSISLVPYAGQVNAGPLFDSLLSGPRVHAYSSCIEIADAEFANLSLPPVGAQTPHFQWFTFERLRGQAALPFDPNGGYEAEWGWCPADEQGVAPFANNPDALRARINAFKGHDGTGTQIGLKWGLGLLSESARGSVQALVDAGLVDPLFAGRPGPFNDPGTQKIVVIMTDGNTRYQQRPTADAYDTEEERAFLAFDEDLLACCSGGYLYPTNQLARNAALATLNTTAARYYDEQDRRAQFLSLCNVARSAGVRVYTIGFDIDDGSNAQDDMSACATTPGDFYDVDGLGLLDAFSQIAVDIQTLRLVMR